jgi:hypothetical protein
MGFFQNPTVIYLQGMIQIFNIDYFQRKFWYTHSLERP